MEFLMGFVCLLFFVAFVAAVFGIASLFLEDFRSGLAVIYRQLRRGPRFGLSTLLQLLAVFAVTFSVLRCAGAFRNLGGDVLILGFIAMVFAIAVVTGMHLVVSDVGELFKRPRRHDTSGFSDSWGDEDKKDELKIESIPEPADPPDNNMDDEPEER